MASRRETDGLLIAACRIPGAVSVPVASSSSIDWDILIARAEHLGIASHLRRYCREQRAALSIPAEALAKLDAIYYASAARGAHLHSALHTLLRAFASEEVDVVLLKGAALASAVYHNVALRPMKDLDLLVRPAKLGAAQRVLQRLGYRPHEWDQPAAWYDGHHHLVPYISADQHVLIEIHHDLVPPSAGVMIPIETLWARAEPVRIDDTDAFVLAPDDLLLHLGVHLTAGDHFYAGLRTLRDIAEVIAHAGARLEWPRLAATALASGAGRHIFVALRIARSLLGASVPPDVLVALSSGSAPLTSAEIWSLETLASRVLVSSQDEPSPFPPGVIHAIGESLLIAQPWPRRAVSVGSTAWRIWRE